MLRIFILGSKEHITQILTIKKILHSARHDVLIQILDFDFDSNSLNEKNWDIFIAVNNIALLSLAKYIKKKPIHFISASDDEYGCCVNLPNLYYSFSLQHYFNPWNLSYPLHKYLSLFPVSSIRNTGYKYPSKTDQLYRLIYLDCPSTSINVANAIISTVNSMPYATLTIISSDHRAKILRQISNDTIEFINSKKFKLNTLNNYHIALANGTNAIQTLLYNLPTIVIGNRGLGGLVDIDNIDLFKSQHFQGRIGGTVEEPTPVDLLSHIIYSTLEKLEHKSINNKSLGKDLSVYYKRLHVASIKQLLESIYSSYQLSKSLNGPNFDKLTPVVCENISALSEGEVILLLRKGTKYIVASVDTDQYRIIENCNSKNTVQQLSEIFHNYTPKEIRYFITQLWELKLIYFI